MTENTVFRIVKATDEQGKEGFFSILDAKLNYGEILDLLATFSINRKMISKDIIDSGIPAEIFLQDYNDALKNMEEQMDVIAHEKKVITEKKNAQAN